MNTPKVPNEVNTPRYPICRPKRYKDLHAPGAWIFGIIAGLNAFFWIQNMNSYSGNPIIGLCCMICVPLFVCAAYLSNISLKMKEMRNLMYCELEKKEDDNE